MLTDLVRQQIRAYASMPVSAARLLAALADAAEASVGVLQQLDERATATNRVLHSFEDPLVRLAEAVDASLVDSTVEALGRLPSVLARASVLAERVDGVISNLEAPVRALGPLAQALDVGRIGGLVDRLEESIPGLIRLPDTEHEVRLLRETLDRMYRVIDEVQGRFGALPGAGLLLPKSPGRFPAKSAARSAASASAPAKASTGRGRGRKTSDRTSTRDETADPEDGGT